MSASFANQTLAQIELFTKPGQYKHEVYVLPKHLDEKVARLHLDALGAHLTTLSKRQAEYLGVDVEGRSSQTTTGTESWCSVALFAARASIARSGHRQHREAAPHQYRFTCL